MDVRLRSIDLQQRLATAIESSPPVSACLMLILAPTAYLAEPLHEQCCRQ